MHVIYWCMCVYVCLRNYRARGFACVRVRVSRKYDYVLVLPLSRVALSCVRAHELLRGLACVRSCVHACIRVCVRVCASDTPAEFIRPICNDFWSQCCCAAHEEHTKQIKQAHFHSIILSSHCSTKSCALQHQHPLTNGFSYAPSFCENAKLESSNEYAQERISPSIFSIVAIFPYSESAYGRGKFEKAFTEFSASNLKKLSSMRANFMSLIGTIYCILAFSFSVGRAEVDVVDNLHLPIGNKVFQDSIVL